MGCNDMRVGAGIVNVDSDKRVNYTLGMLLGVDDFVQESTYHTARRRELARELLGYGTAHGLQVSIEPHGGEGPRLRVSSGMAWLPSGTPVCVATDQCATLNTWLAAHALTVDQALERAPSSPPSITLHVVLSYRSCLTDEVPIPGEPCRSDDELMQPSRVTDSFRLELRLSPPKQCEEDAIRDFVGWLADMPVGASSPALTEEDFIAELRAAADAWLNPTSPAADRADYMIGSAPVGFESRHLLRVALRLWATELRPLWMARFGCGYDDSLVGSADDAVLLATLTIPLVNVIPAWQVSDMGSVEVDESRRPVLASLRLVQELISLRSIQELITDGSGPAPGDSVTSETNFGQSAAAGASLRYSREDHTHGTPTLPDLTTAMPALSGDLSGRLGGTGAQVPRIVRLQDRAVSPPTAPGQALVFSGTEWVPTGLSGDLAGVLGGTEPNLPRVTGLLGRGIATTPAPNDGQALVFDGSQWVPRAITATGDFVGRTAGAYEIVAAGDIALTINNGAFTFPAQNNYGKLFADQGAIVGGNIERAVIRLRAAVPNASALPRYVVKLTPMLTADPRATTFSLFLDEKLSVALSGDTITFQVLLVGASQISDGTFAFRFQVEVSRFGAA